ncbi:hypothetical protein AC1031_019721 [Aphanomyces cochlioides]|nr:hypothetical protein AC1031_019721 [Aphanomyces cochlioides]
MLSRRNTTEPFDRFPPRLNKAKRKGHDIDTKGIHANNPSSIFASFKRKKVQEVEEKPDDLKAKFIEMDAENKRQMQQVPCVEFGRFEIKTWYPSPYPKAFYPHDKLFVCESCLGYTSTKRLLEHHRADECDLAKKRPPGRKVYDEKLKDSSTLTLIEVDGKTDALYCQNLCLFAKLFMDQKTLYFDIKMVCIPWDISPRRKKTQTNTTSRASSSFHRINEMAMGRCSSPCRTKLPNANKPWEPLRSRFQLLDVLPTSSIGDTSC